MPLGLLAALALSLSAPALAAHSVKIDELVVAATIPDAQREATLKAVRVFYDFWNTGDEGLLKPALAESFTDHTQPPGRPQGPEGPAFASRQFRAAVPDLKVALEKMIVAGDLCHRAYELHRPFHRQARPDAGQGSGRRLAAPLPPAR